jgi:MFS family permease
MQRSLWAVIVGTFTLRFSTGLTGSMLTFYLAELPKHGGPEVSSIAVGMLTAAFFAAELGLSPVFGILADRWGYHRVMELGPAFGVVAAILTGLTVNMWILMGTRLLEGASTAASVPSILGFIAVATAFDEGIRGRAVARFEAATLAGLGAGIVAGGFLYQLVGPLAFFMNAGFYCVSWAIYRFGVSDPRAEQADGAAERNHTTLRRYVEILRSSHVWLLAPTWIAVNAALGNWTSQSLFQLVRTPPPEFSNQFLMRGYASWVVSLGLLVVGVIFGAGLVYWGNRFKRYRRTTIIFYGLGGGALLVAAVLGVNHGEALGPLALVGFAALAGVGLFVLAGATPAALGLLADTSEAYPAERGAIMGLYSVFLALGQIGGSLIGGAAAEGAGIDGLLWTTLAFIAIAAVPLWFLRPYEHAFTLGVEGSAPAPAP